MRKGRERKGGYLKDDGDTRERARKGKSHDGNMEMEGGQLFAH